MPAYPELNGSSCTPWITPEEAIASSGGTVPESADLIQAVAAAQGVLFAMSGRQYAGECIGFVRPCRLGCGWGSIGGGDGVDLALAGASWWFGGWGGLGGSGTIWGWWGGDGGDAACGCEPLSEVKLNGYPITGIKEVTINGDVVPADEYRLDRNRYLVRLSDPDGGRRYWPGCQNLSREPGENHTWSIEYYYGAPPPEAGKLACCELAVQFWLALTGSEDCALPIGVTKLTRQGVTIERMVPFFADGTNRTGLPLVDAFLAAYNPAGLRRRPAIMSPGYPKFPRRTPHGTA